MTDPEALDLPTGESVTPDDVFLYNGYPYRFVPLDGGEYAFKLTPLYWGGSGMDVPFADRDALVAQWGPESKGLLTEAQWESWLADARSDDRYTDEELDAIRREVLDEGLVRRLRDRLGV